MLPAPSRQSLFANEARALLRLGGPAIGAQLAQISMSLVDTIMAGQLGAESLASVSLGGSVWMPFVVTGMGLLLSVSPSVAQSFGAGRPLECGSHLRQGLWLSLAVAATLALLLSLCAGPLMEIFGVEPSLIPTASRYLTALAFGMPGLLAFVTLRGFSEGVSMTRPILWISIGATCANIVLNDLFMYGRLGLAPLGAVGCGIATAIVEWLMALGLALFIWLEPHYRGCAPFCAFEPPRLRSLWQLFRIGAPIAGALFCEVSCFAFAGLLIGRFGAEVVSGHQIALNLASLTFMVPLGVSIAICVRVGQFVGAEDFTSARRSGTVGALLCGLFMLFAATCLAVMPHFFVGLYTRDQRVHAVGTQLLLLAALFQLFDGLQVAAAGALRGLKDTRATMLITIVSYWGFGLPLGAWLGLSHGWGATGFWMSFIVSLAAAALLLNLRFQLAMRGRRYRRPAPQPGRSAEIVEAAEAPIQPA